MSQPVLSVTLLHEPGLGESLARLRPEWEALARDAAEPNLFYEPLFLMPALEHLRDDSGSGWS